MKRLAGSRSPSTRTLNLSFERPSCSMAFARHSGGMRRSGSSFIGLGKRSASLVGDARVPARFDPVERVERAVGRARVLLDALLEEARDRALRRADRPVEEDDALLRPVPLGRGLEDVDEAHQRDVEAEDRVRAAVLLVLEEVVADELLLVVDVLLGPVADDHVVERAGTRCASPAAFRGRSRGTPRSRPPSEARVELEVLHRGDALGHLGRVGHGSEDIMGSRAFRPDIFSPKP